MTRDTSQWRFETKSVHAGYTPEPTTHAVAVPLYQTVAYSFDSAQHGADLFDLKVAGNIYTRIMNPTQAVLEERIAALEGGIASLALASGQAAITYAIQTITEAGDNIVASSALYGGTYNLFAHTLPQYGIQARFADYRDPKSFEPLIDARTKAVFVESLGNPQGNITDIAAVAAHPAYVARFAADLVQPGLRIPITADQGLFAEAVRLGREVIWLHTFGERFVDPAIRLLG